MPLLQRSRASFRRFIEAETSGGLVLMGSAGAGLLAANSAIAPSYFAALHISLAGLDALRWINDGLMALFFLLAGLEIKREMLEGQLGTWRTRALPLIAALGGMLVPAAIFVAVNAREQANWPAWAVPTATDIAFALGVLSLVGSRVAHSLKVFLTSLAIIDDLGAILIIALFYGSAFSLLAIGAAIGATAALVLANRLGVRSLWLYGVLGLALWFAMLHSGIHASLAGVVLSMTIPLGPSARGADEAGASPLHRLEHGLNPLVAFLVLPLFGFANAGVSLAGTSPATLLAPLSLGIVAGLFVGKQLGILLATWIAVSTKAATFPEGATWRELHGVALIAGIGFTMSLFIGLLAFDDPSRQDEIKLAVLAGSLLSAIVGGVLLALVPRPIAG